MGEVRSQAARTGKGKERIFSLAERKLWKAVMKRCKRRAGRISGCDLVCLCVRTGWQHAPAWNEYVKTRTWKAPSRYGDREFRLLKQATSSKHKHKRSSITTSVLPLSVLCPTVPSVSRIDRPDQIAARGSRRSCTRKSIWTSRQTTQARPIHTRQR